MPPPPAPARLELGPPHGFGECAGLVWAGQFGQGVHQPTAPGPVEGHIAQECQDGTLHVDVATAVGHADGVAVQPCLHAAVGHGGLQSAGIPEVTREQFFEAGQPAFHADHPSLEQEQVAEVGRDTFRHVAEPAGAGPEKS